MRLSLKLVEGEGFEPSKLSQRIYSPSPLTARESLQIWPAFYAEADPVSSAFSNFFNQI
ncbi:protein of unknown function [Pseudomonas sp. JV241A]|nr:protein of unknown function [Pseudomonas sp. JV241A]